MERTLDHSLSYLFDLHFLDWYDEWLLELEDLERRAMLIGYMPRTVEGIAVLWDLSDWVGIKLNNDALSGQNCREERTQALIELEKVLTEVEMNGYVEKSFLHSALFPCIFGLILMLLLIALIKC